MSVFGCVGGYSNLLIEFYGDSLYHLSHQIEKIKLNNNSNNQILEESIIEFSGWKKNSNQFS